MLVMKFGGASLADAAEVLHSCEAVRAHRDQAPLVVVSASRGVTDQLLEALGLAGRGDLEAVDRALARFAGHHRDLARGALSGEAERGDFLAYLEERLGELEALLRSIAVLREYTPRSEAYVASFGERLSSRLVAACLRSGGDPAEAFDGEAVLLTEGGFTGAFPRLEATRERAREVLLPVREAGHIPVVMGFVGLSPEGLTATLGRGGTDLSASVLAQVLEAREVHYLKEVDGIMSADPRVVPAARRIHHLSYEEVAELSYFGAKVLHPVAVHPLREAGILARIRDVHSLESEGTRVGPVPEDHHRGAKALTTIPGVAVVTVEGGGMQGVLGVAGRVFQATSREGVNVLMISQASSEQNISLVIREQDGARTRALLEAEFELELLKGRVEGVQVQEGLAIVSLVGDGMRGQPGIVGRLFSCLGEEDVNVVLIAQGSSERNVSFVVAGDQVEVALNSIHAAFGLGADGDRS